MGGDLERCRHASADSSGQKESRCARLRDDPAGAQVKHWAFLLPHGVWDRLVILVIVLFAIAGVVLINLAAACLR